MKKYIAEAIGTAVLVIMGCGTAMLVGCDAASGGGYIVSASKPENAAITGQFA